MAFHDPVDKRLQQFAERRYRARCDNDQRLLERADAMREISRIANQALPGELFNSESAIDTRRQLIFKAEERARELIQSQITTWLNAEPEFRLKHRTQIHEDWLNLTGVLASLRLWANNRFQAVENGDSFGES